MLDRRSLEGSSPGDGMAGSFNDKDIATCDRRRSEGIRPRRGDPPRARLPDERRDRSARLSEAAAASDVLVSRGEGESCLSGDEIEDIARGCEGEEEAILL